LINKIENEEEKYEYLTKIKEHYTRNNEAKKY